MYTVYALGLFAVVASVTVAVPINGCSECGRNNRCGHSSGGWGEIVPRGPYCRSPCREQGHWGKCHSCGGSWPSECHHQRCRTCSERNCERDCSCRCVEKPWPRECRPCTCEHKSWPWEHKSWSCEQKSWPCGHRYPQSSCNVCWKGNSCGRCGGSCGHRRW